MKLRLSRKRTHRILLTLRMLREFRKPRNLRGLLVMFFVPTFAVSAAVTFRASAGGWADVSLSEEATIAVAALLLFGIAGTYVSGFGQKLRDDLALASQKSEGC